MLLVRVVGGKKRIMEGRGGGMLGEIGQFLITGRIVFHILFML